MTKIFWLVFFLVPYFSNGQIIRMPWREHHSGTKIIKEKGWFKNDNCVGVWKYYSENGTLIKSIDFDSGEKRYFTQDYRDPYDSLFLKAKSNADSVLLTFFSQSFINEHIKWNIGRSYYYGPKSSGRWFDVADEKPDKFLFRYDILYSKKLIDGIIMFEIDDNGAILASTKKSTTGLANCKSQSANCTFQITLKQAIDIAKENGLKKIKNKFISYLTWTEDESENGILGYYEIVVATLKDKETHDNNTVYTYDAAIIDPWTGDFKERTQLKAYYISHEHSSIYSGLSRE